MEPSCVREKSFGNGNVPEDSGRIGSTSIIVCQHGLLWCSVFIISGTAYAMSGGGLAADALVSESLLLANGSIALLYLTINSAAALCRPNARDKRVGIFQKAANLCLRFSVTAWLLTCGIVITFTMTRHPLCSSIRESGLPLDVGTPCIVQRTTVGASLLALGFTCILFILMHRTREPFRCYLFGIMHEEPLLPLSLRYKTSIYRPNPTFSEISFKCRSSTTLSSRTLVQMYDDSTTGLLSKQPEKTVGLGTYAPRSAMPSFLGPRPSLSSIRSHASIHQAPPASPLPPLPVCYSKKHGRGSAMHTAIYPPQRPQRPARRPSERTVRIVPPSPALSVANLQAFSKSAESLSSVYSRSISGEQYGPHVGERPVASTADNKSFSSSSTATFKKSPLDIMRLPSDPDVVVGLQHNGSDSDSDIDNAAILQARLPSVKTVSDFGEVSSWEHKGHVSMQYYQKSYEICSGEMRKVDFTPLNLRRTRDSASIRSSVAVSVA